MEAEQKHYSWTLLTKEYPKGGNIFACIWRLFRKDEDERRDPLDTALWMLGKLLPVTHTSKIVKAVEAVDDVYGEYPTLVVGNSLIHRNRVLPFLSEVFPLNHICANEEERKKMEMVEYMLVKELYVATQYVYCFSAEAQQFRIVESIRSPVRSYFTQTKRSNYSRILSHTMNINSEEDALGIFRQVHDLLAARLKINKHLFGQPANGKTRIPLTNVLAYAYLKHELDLIPDSLAAKELRLEEKYKGIREFLNGMEEGIGKHEFVAECPLLSPTDLEAVASKYAPTPRLKSSPSLGSQLLSSEEMQTQSIRRLVVAGTLATCISFFYLFRTPAS